VEPTLVAGLAMDDTVDSGDSVPELTLGVGLSMVECAVDGTMIRYLVSHEFFESYSRINA
jgi:hypothetical protein